MDTADPSQELEDELELVPEPPNHVFAVLKSDDHHEPLELFSEIVVVLGQASEVDVWLAELSMPSHLQMPFHANLANDSKVENQEVD